MFVDYTHAGRDALDYALSRAPLHLSYPLHAVRDEGCAFVFVAQGRAAFNVPSDRPAIVLLGDDLHAALGPRGFHERSVRRYLATCQAAAIVASEVVPSLYHEAASWAVVKRENVVIIETRPEREADWFDLIRSNLPADAAIGIATVKPEGNA